MIFIKRFLLMLQFMTSIPIPVRMNVDNKDFAKGLALAPIIGLVIGGVMAGVYMVTSLFMPFQTGMVLVMLTYIVLTGGLHLDGLGDTFDGIFSNRPKEKILEIMRDSRVGTNAVLAVIGILLLNITLLWGIDKESIAVVILLFPVAGRVGSVIGAGISVYARQGEGLGKSFIDHCGGREVAVGILTFFAIFYFLRGYQGILEGIFPVVFAFLSTKFFSRKIDGATGDVLGAVCEMNQTFYLIGMYITKYFGG